MLFNFDMCILTYIFLLVTVHAVIEFNTNEKDSKCFCTNTITTA